MKQQPITIPIVLYRDGEEALHRAVRDWNQRNPEYQCDLLRTKDGQVTALILPDQVSHRAAFEVGRMMTSHLLNGKPETLPVELPADDDPLIQLDVLENRIEPDRFNNGRHPPRAFGFAEQGVPIPV